MTAASARPPAAGRRRSERGQVLLVFALMATLLVGFCGLALDAAVSHYDQRSLQETADAAALAGSYRIFAGSTEAAATVVATQVATDDGCTVAANCTLGIVYQDSTHTTTATAANVYFVVANLSTPHTNQFIKVLNQVSTNTVAASATAQVYLTLRGGEPALGCGLCLLQTGNNVLVGTHSGVTITVTSGDLDVNGAVSLSSSGSSILVPSGKFNVSGTYSPGSWTVNPAATTGTTPISDPLSYLLAPSSTGLVAQGNNVNATNTTVSPGIYGKINTSGTVTFSAGTYIFVGNGSGISNSSAGTILTGSNVLLYFTCGTYPTPAACASGGANGAGINASQSLTLNLSAATTGQFENLLIYYDRNNTTSINFTQNVSGTDTGGVYAAMSQIIITNSTTFTLGAPIVAGSLNITCCGMTFASGAGIGNGVTYTTPGNLYL